MDNDCTQVIVISDLYLQVFFRLGAWQFMADMPYGSLSLLTVWKILWTLYHNQFANNRHLEANEHRERRGSVLTERLDLDLIPETAAEIIQSIQGK